MTVTVKLDTQKIRVLINDKLDVINKIEFDLKSNGYKDIRESNRRASDLRGQRALGYSLSSYSMAYRKKSGELVIEAWLPLTVHYTRDDYFTDMLNSLYAHLFAMDVELEDAPSTMSIAEITPRDYITVFKQNDVSFDGLMTLIRNLESVVSDARKAVDMSDGPRILSEVKTCFDPTLIYAATQKTGLTVFGQKKQNTTTSTSTSSTCGIPSV
jgi:hypothetical protein